MDLVLQSGNARQHRDASTVEDSLESLPSLDAQLTRNPDPSDSTMPSPLGWCTPEDNLQGRASNAAPDLATVADRLEGQFARILHEAFQKHATAVDLHLQLLRGELAALAAFLHHGSTAAAVRPLDPARKGPDTRSSCPDPAAMMVLPVPPRGPYQGRDVRTPEDEAGVVRLDDFMDASPLGDRLKTVLPTPTGPANGSRRSSRKHSKPLDLRLLENGLANELFEAQELHVPMSACNRKKKRPSANLQDPLSDCSPRSNSSGVAMQKIPTTRSSDTSRVSRDRTDSVLSKRFAWCPPTPTSSDRPSSQAMSKEDSGRSSGSNDYPVATRPRTESTGGTNNSPLDKIKVNLDMILDVQSKTVSERTCRAEALRQFREAELTSGYCRDNFDFGSTDSYLSRQECWGHFGAPLVLLRVCGALPWSTDDFGSIRARMSVLYRWTAAGVTLLAFASCIEQAFMATASIGVFSDVSLALGSFFGLLSLGVLQHSTKFSDINNLLFSYADREGLLKEWGHRSCRELAVVLVTWTAAVLVQFAIILFADDAPWSRAARSLAFFTVSSLQLLGLAFSITHVCLGLTCMIDSFCCALVERRDLKEAAREWNVLQAVLRQACAAVERCFFIVQATLVSMILLSIADMIVSGSGALNMLALLPAGVVMLGITRIPFNAASVTDKCARVPPLVNSLSFGQDFDHERQYVVEYIIHSVAGFYVFEVRLTSSMALKFLYVSCVCAFAVATKVVSEWQ